MAKWMDEKKCDYCGKMDFYYHTMHSTKINGTLCSDCTDHIPVGFFGYDPKVPEPTEWSETWTLIMLKLGGKK
jgi:hypothetical protein